MMHKRAGITIFLALVLGVLTALFGACLRSVRMACLRAQIACGADIGLYSLFGQYDRTLLKEYDLFALDASTPGGLADMAAVYNAFRRYMDPVLRENGSNLRCTGGGFSGFRLLTDEDGEVFAYQAAKSREETITPSRFLELGTYSHIYIRAAAYMASGEKALASGRSLLRRAEEMQSEETDPETQNLIRQVMLEEERGILSMLPPAVPASALENSPCGTLLSGRERNRGFAMYDSFCPDTSLRSRLLLEAYLSDFLSCCTDSAETGDRFQLEYVLAGNVSDLENLRSVVSGLFAFRVGVNMEKTAVPELSCGDDLQETVRFCRAYLKAREETMRLLSGEKADFPGIKGGTVSYRDCLEIMLRGRSRHELIWRGMDRIEQSLRSEGKPDLHLDCCLAAAEIAVDVRAEGKKTFHLTKAYGYA